MSTKSKTEKTPLPNNNYRWSLDLDEKANALAESVMERTGARSKADFFRKAVALYDLVTTNREQGGKLVFRHADNTEEVWQILL